MTDAQKLKLWEEYTENVRKSTPVDLSETAFAKHRRMAELEADPEKWFAYYFPHFATSTPADFHKEATKRICSHLEFFEVRHWARELAKSTRTMMEVLYLTLVGIYPDQEPSPIRLNQLTVSQTDTMVKILERVKKKNVIMTSNSENNAERLLLPYKTNLESNNRIINDYGEQVNIGKWESTEFTTKTGAAFRAIGAGQSPRGTRNEATRPDIILVDDIDTDEECLNADIIEKKWNWIQEALIPTRSISNPLLIIMCGNIIAEDCCVVRAHTIADHVDIINIRDAAGKSTWPSKNKEADIDRVLRTISYASAQKEYFNNPMSQGKTFPEITWGACPDMKELQFIVCYSDPSTSNKDRPTGKSKLTNSRKAVVVVGRKGLNYYIYKCFLDQMSSAHFIDAMYACRDYIAKRTIEYFVIENNTLQDAYYQQIYLPLIYQAGAEHGGVLSVTGDSRDKKDKWFRIEANLEPVNRQGHLIFNKEEENDPHMKRLAAQFKAAKPTSKELDGPDAVEGAKYIIDQKIITSDVLSYGFIPRTRSQSKHY